MKKYILITVLLLLFVAASPQKVETHRPAFKRQYSTPMNTQLDSINLKAAELNLIIRAGL